MGKKILIFFLNISIFFRIFQFFMDTTKDRVEMNLFHGKKSGFGRRMMQRSNQPSNGQRI